MRATKKITKSSNAGLLEASIAFELYSDLRFNKERLITASYAEKAAESNLSFIEELTAKLADNSNVYGCKFIICLSEDHVMTGKGALQEPLPLQVDDLICLFKGEVVWIDGLYCQPVFARQRLVGYLALQLQNYDYIKQLQHLIEAYSLLIQKSIEPQINELYESEEQKKVQDGLFNEVGDHNFNLGKLISIATHDLNSLISAIDGYLRLSDQLLADARNFRKIKQYNNQITRGVDAIHEILKQLHDLSRFGQKDKSSYSTILDISWIAHDVGDLLRSLAWKRKQDVQLSVPDIPQYVVGNVVMIKRIITNLLSNAVKYTKEGGAISVSVRSKNDEVIVAVADTGKGIPADKLSAIFKPFTRLGNSDQGDDKNISSLGLGLFLCQKFAKLMNGEITVSSRVGKGSIFCLHLPAPSLHELKAIGAEEAYNHRFI